jgi:hypothetical protein
MSGNREEERIEGRVVRREGEKESKREGDRD